MLPIIGKTCRHTHLKLKGKTVPVTETLSNKIVSVTVLGMPSLVQKYPWEKLSLDDFVYDDSRLRSALFDRWEYTTQKSDWDIPFLFKDGIIKLPMQSCSSYDFVDNKAIDRQWKRSVKCIFRRIGEGFNPVFMHEVSKGTFLCKARGLMVSKYTTWYETNSVKIDI